MSQSQVIAAAHEALRQHSHCAMCTVTRVTGSVPRHAGSKMLVDHRGGILAGTIGGGEMENRVIAAARERIGDGQIQVMDFQLADPASGDPGVCGGTVQVLIEPLLPAPTLLVIGAGHVGRALVHLAGWLGFRTAVADDRVELCTPEACPGANVYLPGPLKETLATFPIGRQTYVALVTRGFPIDVGVLPMLVASEAPYIGVMGSERRWLTAARALEAGGLLKEKLDRVHAPIGLELRAETPEEIAVSILGEIIAQQRGGDGQPMRRSGP
jgi:xanthine dehydrogenase accessory factor